MYVGVGASRVRKLFENARSHKKCIIFIDEIDAIGKKRGTDRNSERDQTLNQILTEMDGFYEDDSIVMVFAATNLVSILDPALLRSGRFDKKIYFDLPNKEERVELYKLYINTNNTCTLSIDSKNNNIIDFDYEYLSNISVGLTGADISNIVNQAKINAIKNKKTYFSNNDIVHAIDEIMIGREKRERTVLPLELKRIACHEAGHAFMSYILDGIESPLKVSILPRGESALGFSLQKPVDIKLYTNNYLIKQLLVLLAGRSSEKVFYNNLSSGAHDDINKITNIVESYFKDFGMSEKYGPINFNKLGKKSLESYGNYNINKDIIDFVQNLEQICYRILTENKESLIIISDLLLSNETIDYNDINNNLNQTLENSIDYSI
jgi:ATP-dependent metalloprotease FtsH